MNLEFSTKWSEGNVIKDDGKIGKLSINGNTIAFQLDEYDDFFARNFMGYADMHKYKVFTYGQSKADASGYFYRVSKVFLYNGDDYSEYSGDYITNITSFSFEIPELTRWLNIESVEFGFLEDKSIVIREVVTPEFPLKENDPHVFIKYERKNLFENIDDKNEKAIKKVPRVFVEFSSPKDDISVFESISIITRFFSLLIGRMSTVEDIRLNLEGKDMKMWLFINNDFSIHQSWTSYWMRNRFEAKNSFNYLQQWFEQWYIFPVINHISSC